MRRALAILFCLTIWTVSLASASAPVSLTQRLRIAPDVAAKNLIHSVDPPYPPLAREAKVRGVVVVEAVVDRSGQVVSTRVITGHPLFKEAVAQYLYKPFLLNGEPVEVISSVGVRFVIDFRELYRIMRAAGMR